MNQYMKNEIQCEIQGLQRETDIFLYRNKFKNKYTFACLIFNGIA
jgi:hypothetical protein